jgi:hypothetical protein
MTVGSEHGMRATAAGCRACACVHSKMGERRDVRFALDPDEILGGALAPVRPARWPPPVRSSSVTKCLSVVCALLGAAPFPLSSGDGC